MTLICHGAARTDEVVNLGPLALIQPLSIGSILPTSSTAICPQIPNLSFPTARS